MHDADTHPILQRGVIGEPVVRLQSLLVAHGYLVSLDGDFGPGTERSVVKLQESRGLPSTGVVDRETWMVLLDAPPGPTSPEFQSELESRMFTALMNCSVASSNALRWFAPLSSACVQYKINTVNQLSGFVANVVHESAHLKGVLVESLDYSAQGLMRTWPQRFPPDLANVVGRTIQHAADQRAIAMYAYGGRMGNRPYPSTDGWDFRGRGPIQLTGFDNYEAFAAASEIDVVSDPDIVLTPEVGSLVAGWFWSTHRCGPYADRMDHRGLRRSINGGVFGLEETTALFTLAKSAF